MKTKHKILIHIAFWVYILNQMLYPVYINKTVDFFYTDFMVTLVLNFINFYIIFFFLPLLLSYKNKLKSIVIGVLLVLALAVFKYYVELYFWRFVMHSPPKIMQWVSYWFSNDLRLSIIYSIYALLIKLAIDWYESQKLKAELILQQQASELALLRSQVNPHFLFNTLNNIYSLVSKKSDDAPAAVMKLSGIMRYMLYDAVADKVLLEKEVEYLRSFIELQNLRLKQKDFVVLDIQGDMNGRTIAPMLLIPFVENAFKHGSRNVANPGILINLFIDTRQIYFEVTSYMRKNVQEPMDGSGGNGLNNIKRRLELVYPGKHDLFIIPGDQMYTVKLTIQDQK